MAFAVSLYLLPHLQCCQMTAMQIKTVEPVSAELSMSALYKKVPAVYRHYSCLFLHGFWRL